MKTVLKLALILLCLGIGFPALAQEKIETFDVLLKVNSDASLQVTEKIKYDFGDDDRHGIFRTIPISYKARGGNYSLRISDIDVADDFGKSVPYNVTTPGRNMEIKIGDANKLVTGLNTYIIKYSVDRAVNYFEEHDELYWNVTGNEWDIPISSASANIIVEGTTDEDLKLRCLAGKVGSDSACAITSLKGDGITFNHSSLVAGSGLTLIVGWPKGVVEEPTFWELAREIVADNWIILVPFITFGILWTWWRRKGRDPKGRGTIVVQYEAPEHLSPAQVGTIVDALAHNNDLTAEIIYLAVQGYMKIKQIEEPQLLLFKKKDYELVKLKEPDDNLNNAQQKLLKNLFQSKKSVRLSDLKKDFYKEWQEVRKEIYKSLVQEKYFPTNPQLVRIVFGVVGVVVAFGGVAVFATLSGAIGVISLLITGVLIVLFGLVMPVRTKKGVLALEHILGLKKYLSVAEKDRLKFHNAPEKKPEHFDKLLPYAMALGVEKEWAKHFKGIDRKPPSWYEGSVGSHLAMSALANNMSSFASAAGSSLSATASSGSSGFSGGSSGGGFGGGGGGSW